MFLDITERVLIKQEQARLKSQNQDLQDEFKLANGGTNILDEIGENPLEVRSKLLGVLHEREFDRIGGKEPVKVDVRVIVATNRD